MKKSKTREKKANPRGITRREFVGTTALAAAGVMAGAPAILRGRDLNGKLDIAFIACGGRARASLSELTVVPGRATGRGRGGENSTAPAAPHPDENVVIICDVNDVALDQASQTYPKAKRFNDFRKIFDDPSGFDAVVVSTAEQTHAFATYLALTHGKHVYCEKPLTYNIWEARLIRETA
jgi:predicted dehydrogenase